MIGTILNLIKLRWSALTDRNVLVYTGNKDTSVPSPQHPPLPPHHSIHFFPVPPPVAPLAYGYVLCHRGDRQRLRLWLCCVNCPTAVPTGYGLTIKVCCLYQAMLCILLRVGAYRKKSCQVLSGRSIKLRLRKQFPVRSGGPKEPGDLFPCGHKYGAISPPPVGRRFVGRETKS